MKIEESLNVTFDETPPPSKTSPLVDDDLDEEEALKVTEKKNLKKDIEGETLKIDEVANIKESRNHPLENVIGNLNQKTLRSQAQNQRTKWVYRNKLYENDVVSRNKARLQVIPNGCKGAFLNGFINEEVYVAQPPRFIDFENPDHVYKLKKALYGLKQVPKTWDRHRIVVYADSDHAGDYVDKKRTSGVCTFMECCLISWFSKKQIALAISTIEAEYVSARKACQQALWMKQALIDYDI
nr:copia protein [Tanacetum cinerariifolium]